MELGFYVNFFEVSFQDTPVQLMLVQRSKFSDLRSLRQELADRQINAQVYSSGEVIYGYGPQMGSDPLID